MVIKCYANCWQIVKIKKGLNLLKPFTVVCDRVRIQT